MSLSKLYRLKHAMEQSTILMDTLSIMETRSYNETSKQWVKQKFMPTSNCPFCHLLNISAFILNFFFLFYPYLLSSHIKRHWIVKLSSTVYQLHRVFLIEWVLYYTAISRNFRCRFFVLIWYFKSKRICQIYVIFYLLWIRILILEYCGRLISRSITKTFPAFSMVILFCSYKRIANMFPFLLYIRFNSFYGMRQCNLTLYCCKVIYEKPPNKLWPSMKYTN